VPVMEPAWSEQVGHGFLDRRRQRYGRHRVGVVAQLEVEGCSVGRRRHDEGAVGKAGGHFGRLGEIFRSLKDRTRNRPLPSMMQVGAFAWCNGWL